MRVMPSWRISRTAISLARLRSNTSNGPQRLVGSAPTKKERPMLISGKVPPNWCTVAMPWSLASRGVSKAMVPITGAGMPMMPTVPCVRLSHFSITRNMM